MAARRLSTPGWLNGGAPDTLRMAQFDFGGNTPRPSRARPPSSRFTIAFRPAHQWSAAATPCQAARRSDFTVGGFFWLATHRSCCACRFTHACASLPSAAASRMAMSAVMRT